MKTLKAGLSDDDYMPLEQFSKKFKNENFEKYFESEHIPCPLCHARFKIVLRLFRHAKYYTLTGHHLSLPSCKLQSRGLITEKIMEKRRANYCTQ